MAGWGDYVTSTISVTLVLFILGLVGVINISFDGVSRQVKEKMGFTVVLADSVAPAALDSMKAECANAPMSRASWAERKQSWYSGSWDRRSISSWEGVVPGSRMMWAGIPFFRHRAHTPAAAPTASLSGEIGRAHV